MKKSQRKVKIPWSERAYTDWSFGMYPTNFEKWKRRCVIIQFFRFIVLSIKFKKTAAIGEQKNKIES